METKTSICDNCIHKKVCAFKDDVIRFTNNIVTDLKYVPSILEISFNCQEKEKLLVFLKWKHHAMQGRCYK